MSTPQPEPHTPAPDDAASEPFDESYEAWRDLQDVLEERDREWWAEADAETEDAT